MGVGVSEDWACTEEAVGEGEVMEPAFNTAGENEMKRVGIVILSTQL